MSSNNKPICVDHGSGLFQPFVVSHAGRAATGLQEHRYFHTGICVCLNYVNNSIEVQLGKKFITWLLIKTLLFLLRSMMFEQLHVFFSQISLFNSFFLNAVCAQCLDCTTPRARGSKLLISGELQLTNAINLCMWAAIPGHQGCTALPFPSLSNLLRSAGAPKHAKLKFALRKIEWRFFPWNELFLWTSLPARLLVRIFAEMECRSGTNAAKLNTFTDVKGFCRLVSLFGVRTVTWWRLTKTC